MAEFRMPSLGADMDAGTLIAWHIAPGDKVERGKVVADIETDKGIVEVEIWQSGVVASLAVPPGTKVPVGTVLAILEDSAPTHQPPPRPAAAQPPRVLASPAAKQLARERGLDVAAVHGTGPHGEITRADVARADVTRTGNEPQVEVEQAVPQPPPRTPSVRRAIATAMARSKREIPHYYLSADVDAETATRWLEGRNAGRPPTERLLFATLLLKATAHAVREVPEMNGVFVDGEFRPSKAVHLGIAISLRQGGLIAPAIHDADSLGLVDMQEKLRDLVTRTRAGKLRSSEMADATLTLTNLGEQGVQSVFGVIYPPQVALVGFGKVTERAWARNGMIGARPIVTATLAGDHRVSDGHRGARFLETIGNLLQRPEEL